jgi:hypothetical protein
MHASHPASTISANGLPEANEVSGALTIQGQTFKLTHAHARQVVDDFDKSAWITMILVTDRPIPEAARDDPMALFRLYSDGTLNGVKLEYREGGSNVSILLMSGLLDGSVSVTRSGSHVQPTVFTPTRVEGRAEIAERTMGSVRIALDVRFAVDVAPRIVVAEPTEAEIAAAQTSSASMMYLALNKAIHAGDKAGLLAAVEPDKRAMMDTPDFPQMLKAVQSMTPNNVKVLRAVETAEQAILTVSAVQPDGRTERGKVTLTRGPNGQWYMAGEDWGTP